MTGAGLGSGRGLRLAHWRSSDPSTWPAYDVKQLSPEEFYKVEQAYAAWHQAHPTPQAVQ